MKNYYAERFAAEKKVNNKIETPPPAPVALPTEPPPAPVGEWYYLYQGKTQGPVTERTIREFGHDCLVWKRGLPDWQPVSALLPSPSYAAVPVSYAPISSVISGYRSPSAAQPVSSAAIWTWAFSPLLDLFIRADLFTTPAYFLLWFVIQTILFAWDSYLIKESGQRNDFWGWYWLIGGFYLFVRAAKLQVSNVQAWIWLGCLIGSVIVSVIAQ